MNHANYYEINAKTYYEAGYQEGKLFGDYLLETIEELKRERDWQIVTDQLRHFIPSATRALPHLIDELHGYADGAGVEFEDMCACVTDELFEKPGGKCTTVVTNNGRLIAHNEDWDSDAANSICVLRKNIGELTTLELFYFSTLGGNAISINSNGFIHTINSLSHSDRQNGIPRNIIARWLSETIDPDGDFIRLSRMKRASGYNHNIVSLEGTCRNIECSAKKQILSSPGLPFIHTNHYLSSIKNMDTTDRGDNTYNRFETATAQVKEIMQPTDIKELMDDSSAGKKHSIFNEKTIARMVIDLENMTASIWLLREADRGWIDYNLDFITTISNRTLS